MRRETTAREHECWRLGLMLDSGCGSRWLASACSAASWARKSPRTSRTACRLGDARPHRSPAQSPGRPPIARRGPVRRHCQIGRVKRNLSPSAVRPSRQGNRSPLGSRNQAANRSRAARRPRLGPLAADHPASPRGRNAARRSPRLVRRPQKKPPGGPWPRRSPRPPSGRQRRPPAPSPSRPAARCRSASPAPSSSRRSNRGFMSRGRSCCPKSSPRHWLCASPTSDN